ncbi:hypothetical protein PINS_up011036 [Pythium insidiosum]|nr:hypothetical protein PINS_up011036 [Pythium insidiosum]
MNRVLRRLVHDEETADRERRQRLQQIMKQRNAEALAAASGGGSSAADADAPKASGGGVAVRGTDEEDTEDAVEQQKLLASTHAHWSCLEDSQQSMCIALNRRQTLFAVGEKDGRLSIWDNTTIRVITRELDPTLIVLPEDDITVAINNAKRDEAAAPASPQVKRRKVEDLEDSADGDSVGNEDASVDDESVTNDEGSVEAEDDDDDAGEEDVEDDASVEENASVDDDHEQHPDDPEDSHAVAPLDDDTVMAEAAPTGQSERQNSSDVDGNLTLEALKIAKTALKHVLSCAWSCDSRLLFAGCEEKSNRRGTLVCLGRPERSAHRGLQL